MFFICLLNDDQYLRSLVFCEYTLDNIYRVSSNKSIHIVKRVYNSYWLDFRDISADAQSQVMVACDAINCNTWMCLV